MNDALREYIRGARLEAVVRAAVREEVRAAKGALTGTGERTCPAAPIVAVFESKFVRDRVRLSSKRRIHILYGSRAT